MKENFVEIPLDAISEQASTGVIKSHLLKQMSSEVVIGSNEFDVRITKIKEQIHRGTMLLVFDKTEESVIVITKIDYEKFRKNQEKVTPIWHGAIAPGESDFP